MIFDLKGSNRKVKFSDNETRWWVPKKNHKIKGHKKCMVDNNLIEISRDFNHTLLNFPQEKIDLYSKMIEDDSNFLREHNLIDYSLLLVIEFIDSGGARDS